MCVFVSLFHTKTERKTAHQKLVHVTYYEYVFWLTPEGIKFRWPLTSRAVLLFRLDLTPQEKHSPCSYQCEGGWVFRHAATHSDWGGSMQVSTTLGHSWHLLSKLFTSASLTGCCHNWLNAVNCHAICNLCSPLRKAGWKCVTFIVLIRDFVFCHFL